MEELEKILNTLNMAVWLVDFVTLCIFFFVCQRVGRVNSSLLTMVLVVLAGFFMLGYQAILETYMENHPGYNPVINFLWYMGFVGFYIVILTYLNKIHKFKNLRIGSLGQYINGVYLALGVVQVAQYAEILIFKSDQYMDLVYRLSIPTINIASTIVCFYLACYAAYYLVHKKVQAEELRWTI